VGKPVGFHGFSFAPIFESPFWVLTEFECLSVFDLSVISFICVFNPIVLECVHILELILFLGPFRSRYS